jgi:hypothetical protein
VAGQGRRRAACGRSGTDVGFGGPAIVGLGSPTDRKLCVPAFRRVCPWQIWSVGFLTWRSRSRGGPASHTQACTADCRHLATLRKSAGVRNFRTGDALLGKSRRTARWSCAPTVNRECQLQRSQLLRRQRRRVEPLQ